MGNLSNLYVSKSFQSLIHLATDNTASANLIGLEDGYGNPIGVSVNTTGDLSISGSFTASLQEGYVWVGNSSGKTTTVSTSSFGGGTSVPAGTISGSAQITALGFVSSSVTASSIVTASIVNDDITFTKGDGTQFTIQVATGSFALSSSFAETASIARNLEVIARNGNASTLGAGTVVHITGASGDNPIFNTASFDTELLSANTLGILRYSSVSGADVQVIVNGIVTGVDTDPALGYAAGDVLYLSSSGQFTKVQPQAPNQIVVLGQVLRAQQNNGSIYVSINNGWELDELHNVQITSPQTNQLLAYESASYGLWKNKSFSELGLATTGSNSFSGNQTVSGFVSASNGFRSGPNTTALEIGDGSNVRFISGSSYYNVQLVPGIGDIAFSRDGLSNTKVFVLAGAAGNVTNFQNNPVEFQSSVGGVTLSTPLAINAGVNSNVDITGSLKISSNFDAPLAQGFVWVGDSAGRTTTVATSSFGGGGTTDITALNAFTASQYVSNSYFATTGSNNFIGVETINSVVGTGQGEVYLLADSGSLVIGNSTATPTYAALLHLSSSQLNGNTNLIFKTNTGTPDTIISGSSNIFSNPSNVTAGFKRYIGGSQNYYGATLPQLTGSAAFSPTMTSNIVNSGMIFRLPVSSSACTINSNMILGAGATAISFGTSAANNFERAVSGLTFNNNVINGTVSAVASKTPLSASISITNNNIGGGVTLNMDSSSINFAGNTFQGALTVNNSYFPSTINNASALSISSGLFMGTNSIYASGSNATFTQGRFVSNGTSMVGNANVISASLNGDNTNVQSTILLGQALNVIGSNSRQAGATMPDWGSVFVGRFNDINGTRDMSAETVFAVGTGTAEASRKTGLLIDSGSNMFVEGTLNVSGATSLNGNLNITGSLTASLQQGYVWVGDSSGLTTTVATSSFGGGGGGAAFPYTGSAQITGSLGITGSLSSLPITLSVASSTASIDMRAGNAFILDIPTATTTHIVPTNIIAGQTLNLLLRQPSTTGSIAWSPIVLFPSGLDMQATATGSAIDLVSMISFDTTNLMAANVKNLK